MPWQLLPFASSSAFNLAGTCGTSHQDMFMCLGMILNELVKQTSVHSMKNSHVIEEELRSHSAGRTDDENATCNKQTKSIGHPTKKRNLDVMSRQKAKRTTSRTRLQGKTTARIQFPSLNDPIRYQGKIKIVPTLFPKENMQCKWNDRTHAPPFNS